MVACPGGRGLGGRIRTAGGSDMALFAYTIFLGCVVVVAAWLVVHARD
jgi:hypothetical protein